MPRHRLSPGSARVEQARAASRDGPGGGSGSDEHPRRGPRRPTRYSRRRLRQPSWLRCAGTSVRRNFGAPELRCISVSGCAGGCGAPGTSARRDFGTPGLRCAGLSSPTGSKTGAPRSPHRSPDPGAFPRRPPESPTFVRSWIRDEPPLPISRSARELHRQHLDPGPMAIET